MIRTTTLSFSITLWMLVLVAATAMTTAPAVAQERSSVDLVAIDAIPDGNEATILGDLDGCVETQAGSEVQVDVIVDAIPEDQPLVGFQYDVTYDPEMIEIIDFDYEFLLAAEGTFQPLDGLTDEVPDSDGLFTVAVLDVASNVDTDENMETGPGVLTRITLRAIAAGASEVGINFEPPNIAYPALISTENEPVQIDNIGAATIAADEPCPEGAEPLITALPAIDELLTTPAPNPVFDVSDLPEPEGGGVNVALLSAAIALGVLGAGALAGGWLLLRRIIP